MARQFEHALIVDDSRTARAVLKHMLSKEAFKIEAVESAEQALGYLTSESTDVIFMDHMMPGMDGFAAVKNLKSNEATAHIPIVMYTSKEGEVYKGQAKALGAAAILSKPATQEQLHATLTDLATEASEKSDQAASEVQLVEVVDADHGLMQNDAARTDAITEQAVADKAASTAAVQGESAPISSAANTASSSFWIWVAGIAALLVALLGARTSIVYNELENAKRNNAALLNALLDTSNIAGQYPSSEVPFAGTRIEVLDELLRGAQSAGFKGAVIARGHVGQFCQRQMASGELFVANDGLAISECDVIGQNAQAALRRSGQQTSAFKAFVANNAVLANGDIRLRIEGVGSEEPVTDYPAVNSVNRAGDWNSVARQNNRVEFDLLSDL